MESLKKTIVDEVLRRLGDLSRGDRRRALAVITGVPSDPTGVLSRIEATGRAGFRVTALRSKSAGRVILPDDLAKSGSVLVDDEEPAPALVNGADLVVVPWLSLNTASKVAHLICDTPAAGVLVLALLLGKPVIACADEFDPQNMTTLDLPRRFPELHRAITGLCQRLRAYGVRLVPGREFPAALASWSLPGRHGPGSGTTPSGLSPGQQDAQGKRRVVTREDVMKAINQGEPIRLTPGTILTPLAKEVAESRGWPVIEEGQRCGPGW